ncbi:MAG: FAD-dependent oxidoreductase [Thermodesulfovibrionales bacterium]|nr:FAD-dependent oxidoreductase [Thermodesulfovibrionales bacterium]
MITISINGNEIKTTEGTTVLEAAIKAGIYIPHLCYHPDLTPTGACRLCIVKIEGVRGYPPSCATIVRDNMVIYTDSPEIIKMRKNLVWLLLSGYPGDPKENTLLKKVVDYVGMTDLIKGFVRKPRNLPVRTEEPLFNLNPNLCILCERCVRICHDIRGAGIVGYVNRGIETVVTTAFDCSFKDADCRFCRACVQVCPSGALSDKEFFTEEERDLKLLPCKNTCPAGIDIPRYLRLIVQERFQDSLEVIRERVPFPHVLGLVCTHPCETVCLRNAVSEPIAINALKRFVAELDDKRWKNKLRFSPHTGKKVAIVGSGPAGLTAAWYLRLLGHSVTIFEKSSKLGGTMRLIPDYRLPKSILEKEIEEIISIGINISLNTKIECIDELFNQGFDAIFLAIGATKGLKMGIPGEDDVRVQDGISLLKSISEGEKIDVSGDFSIIGGGNVAIDVARSLIRLGAENVTIIYRRTMDEMPANPEEVTEALHEGIKFEFLTSPIKVITDNKRLKLECLKMQLVPSEIGGRKQPLPIEGSNFIIETDKVIMAIGQISEPFSGIELKKNNFIAVNKDLETSKKGVYAGGDVVHGPLNVIAAIRAGRIAASSIDRYLGGNGNIDQQFVPSEKDDPWMGREEGFCYAKRITMPTKEVTSRLSNFDPVELGFTKDMAIKEAKRCLRCQLRLTISRDIEPF